MLQTYPTPGAIKLEQASFNLDTIREAGAAHMATAGGALTAGLSAAETKANAAGARARAAGADARASI